MRNVPSWRLMMRILMILIAISIMDVSLFASIHHDGMHMSMTEHSSEHSEDPSRSLQNIDIEQDEEFIPYPTCDMHNIKPSWEQVFGNDQPDIMDVIRHEGEPPENT